MARNSKNTPPPQQRRHVGYARASTVHEMDAQVAQLRGAGCDRIFEEHDQGTSHARPVATRLIRELSEGDVMVVVRLDRLARSVNHLLVTLEDLKKRGVHFRSLCDPIDTTTPRGIFSLRVLRSVVELEHALISERTKSGMKAAKAKGRHAGNPGLRERRPDAIRATTAARDRIYLESLTASAESWLPTVMQLRPQHSWENVTRVLTRRGLDWTVERLRRAVNRMVEAELAPPDLLTRSPRRPPKENPMKLVAAIAIADPTLSLRAIATQLDQLGERPPRGGRWQPSSIKVLKDEAFRLGLLRI